MAAPTMRLCPSLHFLLDLEETPGSPARLGWINLERALRWRYGLAKQVILRRRYFPLRSLVIFLVRDRLVLHFLLCIQSCAKIDWWSTPGTRFGRWRSSNERPGTSGISGLLHPSGTPDRIPGMSDWSPSTLNWSIGSSRRSLIISDRRCLINGPGLGVWHWQTQVHPWLQ